LKINAIVFYHILKTGTYFEIYLLNKLYDVSFVNRIQVNREREIDIITNYTDIMTFELEITLLEVKIVLNLFPNNFKPLSEFNNAIQSDSWMTPHSIIIMSFKTTAENCQNTLVLFNIIFLLLIFVEYCKLC